MWLTDVEMKWAPAASCCSIAGNRRFEIAHVGGPFRVFDSAHEMEKSIAEIVRGKLYGPAKVPVCSV
jgi:hypothetical protein